MGDNDRPGGAAPSNAERGGGPNPGERRSSRDFGTPESDPNRGGHDHERGTPTERDRNRGGNNAESIGRLGKSPATCIIPIPKTKEPESE